MIHSEKNENDSIDELHVVLSMIIATIFLILIDLKLNVIML